MIIKNIFISIIITLFLSGCASGSVQLDSSSHFQKIEQDRKDLSDEGADEKMVALSLELAISKAIEQNFDARLARFNYLAQQDNISLQQLKTLPSFEASARRAGRSNKGASSSESAIDGDISLEPSFSTEPVRTIYDIETKWNLTDAALAYIESRTQSNQQEILKTRYQKVRNGIIRDVYKAYWEAYFYQISQPRKVELTSHLRAQLKAMDRAYQMKMISAQPYREQKKEYLEIQKQIEGQIRPLELAITKLKSLTGLEAQKEIYLTEPETGSVEKYKKILRSDISRYEDMAFQERPEMREEYLAINRNANERQKEILRVFPGAELLYAYNNDENKFLKDHSWFNYSVSLTQSLKQLIMLPKQLDVLENEKQKARLKRLNLGFAIISQVHISRAQLEFSMREYELAEKIMTQGEALEKAQQARLQTGMAARAELLKDQARAFVSTLENKIALSRLHGAYINFIHSTGQYPPVLKPLQLAHGQGAR